MKRLSTISLMLMSIGIAHAEEGIIPKLLEYDVEVIIFEDANARYINSEDWTQDAILAAPVIETNEPSKDLIEPGSNETNTTSFKNIKPGILKKEYKRINNSKEYNVLFYGSWRQTGLEEKKAFKINIKTLKNAHKKATSKNTITGYFRLVLARYLHIYSELEYQRNTVTDVAAEPAGSHRNETYSINNHRRMRSKELHYIDHPLVGMLIQINPVKVSTEETAEKPAAL